MSSLFLLLNQSAYAVEIIGNLTGTYSTSMIADLTDVKRRAVKFQMGTQAHTLDNVKIVLFNSPSGSTEYNAETFVELHADSGTPATPDSAVIATLNPNSLTHTNYVSTPTEVTFTPASTITLQANTIYWIVVRGGSPTNYLLWSTNNGNAGLVPTNGANGAGTYLDYGDTADGGISWTSPIFKCAIQINGTAVSSGGIVNAPIDLNFSKQVESYSTEIEVK